jgi:hypothetical protein
LAGPGRPHCRKFWQGDRSICQANPNRNKARSAYATDCDASHVPKPGGGGGGCGAAPGADPSAGPSRRREKKKIKNLAMPTVATGEISTLSSGLLFSANSQIGENISKPPKEPASNNPKEIKSPESTPSIRTAVDGGLVSPPNPQNPNRSNKVWLYPAPTSGGELSDEQRKFVILSEPRLQIWESIILFALFWVSWSV